MANKKTKKKSTWGGRREGAGAEGRIGGTVKFSISVTEQVWKNAEEKWPGNRSQLFDLLLRGFVAGKAII